MWQRGPGEGYMAAKDDALCINPLLRCRRIDHRGSPVGFVVEDESGKVLGKGKLSRDAWGAAFLKLGGRYHKGNAVLPDIGPIPR